MSLTLFWTENTWIDFVKRSGWGLQHFRMQHRGFVLVTWQLCSDVLGMWVRCLMMFGLKDKTECCPVSALWTLLNLWGEIGVDSIPFFSLSLCLYVSRLSLSTHSINFIPNSLASISPFLSLDHHFHQSCFFEWSSLLLSPHPSIPPSLSLSLPPSPLLSPPSYLQSEVEF